MVDKDEHRTDSAHPTKNFLDKNTNYNEEKDLESRLAKIESHLSLNNGPQNDDSASWSNFSIPLLAATCKILLVCGIGLFPRFVLVWTGYQSVIASVVSNAITALAVLAIIRLVFDLLKQLRTI